MKKTTKKQGKRRQNLMRSMNLNKLQAFAKIRDFQTFSLVMQMTDNVPTVFLNHLLSLSSFDIIPFYIKNKFYPILTKANISTMMELLKSQGISEFGDVLYSKDWKDWYKLFKSKHRNKIKLFIDKLKSSTSGCFPLLYLWV